MSATNEQYELKESFSYLELCCKLAGAKYGNANFSAWTNSDYINLSSRLSHQTDVLISPSTLKRIFGKLKTPERYYPQKATRDALAKFAGFEDWDKFVQQHPLHAKVDQVANEPQPSIRQQPSVENKKKRSKFFIPFVSAAAILLFVSVFLMLNNKKTASDVPKGIRLICDNPEGECPHSATFRIEKPKNFNGDTNAFTINYGDGKSDRPINSSVVTTHYYETPGRFFAVLKYNDKPTDTIAIYLKTNGWSATGLMHNDSTRVYPVNTSKIFKNGKLHVTTHDLLEAGIDTTKTFFVRFTNAKLLPVDGDNFELTTNVTTSQDRPGVRCSQVNIYLYGVKSYQEIVFMKPGCVSWANIRFSDYIKSGERNDLHSLGSDLRNSGTIRLRVANKNAELYLNEKLVYTAKYKLPLQKIYGVTVYLAGIGTIHSMSLTDLETGKVFLQDLLKGI